MKLHLIALAGLLAASGAAQAKIDDGKNNPGNGELFLSIWDNNGTAATGDDRSYTRDLGIALNDFASAAASPVAKAVQPEFMFAADATLNSWLAIATDLDNLRWNVAGFDAYQHDRAIMTVSAGFAGSKLTYSDFRNVATSAGVHLAAVNTLGDNTDVNVDVSNIATSANGDAYSGGVAYGKNVGGRLDFTNDGGIGESLDFWMFSETVPSGSTTTTVKQFGFEDRTWTLAANGNLTYAMTTPVPEPETYALMLAGLGLVGFLARRRMQA